MVIILQVLDAASKDSTVKHVMSGVNPQDVKVASFTVLSDGEIDQGYLWRHAVALPTVGKPRHLQPLLS